MAIDSVTQHWALVELIRSGNPQRACAAFLEDAGRGEAAGLRTLEHARAQWDKTPESEPASHLPSTR